MSAVTPAPDGPAPARAFSPVVVFWMVVVALMAFGGFTVLSAYAPDLRDEGDGAAHALSKSAIGFAGLRELLTARGDVVVVGRGGPRAAGLHIFTPGEASDDAALGPMRALTPKLVILPKWGALPDPRHRGWVIKAGVVAPDLASSAVSDAFFAEARTAGALKVAQRRGVARPVLRVAAAPRAPETARVPLTPGSLLRPGPVEALQTVSGDGWKPIVVDEAGRGVLVQAAKEPGLYVLADPDLLNNHGLADFATAEVGVALIDGLNGTDGGSIVQDVTLNGFKRSRGFLKLAFEPPFLGLTLAALGAALLMGLHAAVRFGPARASGRALALGTRALADNSAGLIRLAGREPGMASAYVALVRAGVARAVGAPRELTGEALDQFLDSLGRARGLTHTAAGLAAAARTVRTRPELMRLAGDLNDWKMEMTRDRR